MPGLGISDISDISIQLLMSDVQTSASGRVICCSCEAALCTCSRHASIPSILLFNMKGDGGSETCVVFRKNVRVKHVTKSNPKLTSVY